MKKYPVGIQDFERLIEGQFVYVDKTREIYDLISRGNYYFLSRPRRFGKSLLLSTIKYLFAGEKDLFRGLWIEKRHSWEKHPVLHLSFSGIGYKNIGLERALLQELDIYARQKGFTFETEGLAPRFKELMGFIGGGAHKLVLLIDEYDKPLVDFIDDPEQAEVNRNILRTFFSAIKDSDPFIRFFLITGVSKFSKVSLFSDLNHLEDITLAPYAATVAGYTQDELEHYFSEELNTLAALEGITTAAIQEKVKHWYNGYRWGREERIYNPFSILNLVKQQRFENFWWDTGTPTFLIKKLRENFQYHLDMLEASSTMFESFTLDNMDWLPLLFQTGYVTIKSYDPELRLYTLGFPNLEVKDSMQQHLLAAYRETSNTSSYPVMVNIKRTLDKKDMEGFISQVDILFSTIPYQIFLEKQEAFFHAILHITFVGLGLITQAEVSTAKGRVDSVVFTPQYIYLMEFKLDAPVSEAMEQIRLRQYGTSYIGDGREVFAVGISFSSAEKCVKSWEIKPYLKLLEEA
ncbi:MAG: AAA family ATPase [Bacteroidia bacterium]|nr:AAA family ATPase [Bacteroidia bacterium]